MNEQHAILYTTWLITASMLALLHLHIAETEEWNWRSLGWASLVSGIALNTLVNLSLTYDWPVLHYGAYLWLFLILYVVGAISVIVAICLRLAHKEGLWGLGFKRLAIFWIIVFVTWICMRAWYAFVW